MAEKKQAPLNKLLTIYSVSYTHLTLPTGKLRGMERI